MAHLYCVTMPYFDGDHDHGQYDLGIWSSWDGAKAAAEQLAEYCSPGEWEWKKLSGRPHSILCTGMYTDTYICVGNVRIDEPLPDDLEECLSITYT